MSRSIRVPIQSEIRRPEEEPSKLFRVGKALITSLWQRRPRLNVEYMYYRNDRELTPPDPFKPTSLTSAQIRDIWLLNSKL